MSLDRRRFLRLGLAGTGTAVAALPAAASAAGGGGGIEETSIAELRRRMQAGEATARQITEAYLERIDRLNPTLRAVIETNPDAVGTAEQLDAERAGGRERGPLHGIPILLKDNIDTADRTLTTAGSLALVDSRPARDATVAAKLRAAGAVLLGKANLSEWANFRSTRSSSGWSARGGQGSNVYALDRTPSGSSSGSAQAVAASLAAAAIGTETDGSILSPAGSNMVVGIKPTVGLTSRAGVIPIADSQDTVGPFGRTVADAAAVLGALTHRTGGADPRDPATRASGGHAHTDYTRFLDPDGLRGARIGVARQTYFGYSPHADAAAEAAIRVLRARGAVVVDPADIPTAAEMAASGAEFTVLLYEFKDGINRYLAGRGSAVRTLAELIAFNIAHAGEELVHFGQEIFEQAQEKGPLTDPAYVEALRTSRQLSRERGIDAVLREHRLDALVTPTTAPPYKIDHVNGDSFLGASSQPAAMAGYPAVTVPAGFASGLPLGVTFTGTAWSEPVLLRLAFAFEQATAARQPPSLEPPTVG